MEISIHGKMIFLLRNRPKVKSWVLLDPLLSTQINLIHGSRIIKETSAVYDFAPTVTKFCVMWEGQALPHDTKFCNCISKIEEDRVNLILHPWINLMRIDKSGSSLCTPGPVDSPGEIPSHLSPPGVPQCTNNQYRSHRNSWQSATQFTLV